jgi:hypothetical protein
LLWVRLLCLQWRLSRFVFVGSIRGLVVKCELKCILLVADQGQTEKHPPSLRPRQKAKRNNRGGFHPPTTVISKPTVQRGGVNGRYDGRRWISVKWR